MAEISNRAVATAAAGALLAVGLAFVGKADAQEYDRAVRCGDGTVRSVAPITRSREGAPVAYGCLVRDGRIVRLGAADRALDPELAGI